MFIETLSKARVIDAKKGDTDSTRTLQFLDGDPGLTPGDVWNVIFRPLTPEEAQASKQ